MAEQSTKQLKKIILSTITGNLGSGILTFIIGLLILKNTNSALDFGISQMIGPVVALLLLPFTGSIVDKFAKKKILIISQIVSMVSLSVYVGVIFMGQAQTLKYIYLLLICLKISDQFLSTAYTAALVNLVRTEDIQKVKSLQQIVLALVAVGAPVFGTFLYNLLPLWQLVVLEIIVEGVTLLLVYQLDFQFSGEQTASTEQTEASLWVLFKEGLHYVAENQKLKFALFFSMLINFMFGAVNIGLPYLQVSVYKFPDLVYGVTEALFSFGMIASGLYLSGAKEADNPLRKSWQKIILMGILFMLLGGFLAFKPGTWFVIGLICLFNLAIGVTMTMTNVPMTVWITTNVPENFQGRVFNLLNTLSQLLVPAGILLFSFLFEHYWAALLFLVAGFMIVLISVVYPLWFKIDLKEK